jgi:hypothetical protein
MSDTARARIYVYSLITVSGVLLLLNLRQPETPRLSADFHARYHRAASQIIRCFTPECVTAAAQPILDDEATNVYEQNAQFVLVGYMKAFNHAYRTSVDDPATKAALSHAFQDLLTYY